MTPAVLRTLLTRLQSHSSPKLTRMFITFMSLFIAKVGADKLIAALDQVQKGFGTSHSLAYRCLRFDMNPYDPVSIFAMLLERVWIPNMNIMSDPGDARICSVGLTSLLCGCTAMLTEQYAKFWSVLQPPSVIETKTHTSLSHRIVGLYFSITSHCRALRGQAAHHRGDGHCFEYRRGKQLERRVQRRDTMRSHATHDAAHGFLDELFADPLREMRAH
jgi:hypothetical protein